MSSSSHYALIAISNVGRAAAFRAVVSTTLRLDAVLVRDGDAALQEIARRGAPACLIVDLSLPRVDGFAVVRRVRRQASDSTLCIVAVAAHESLRAAARELSGSLGISAILPLDVDDASLRDVLAAKWDTAVEAPALEPLPSPHAGRSGDPDEIIERAALEARRRFKMPVSVGYLRIGEQEHLTFHVATRDAEAAATLGDTTEFKFLRQVAEARDPLVIPSVEEHPVFARHLGKGPKPIRGFAAVPVPTSRSGTRAALCILDVKPVTLSAADIDAFTSFGQGVGRELDRALIPPPSEATSIGALEINTEDVKALQHLASTDPLTGLANRRGGEKHIANEISRAKRERRPLSCILLDIDRFKQVNDTYGHQAGDQLLRDVSALLRRTVRAYDILVRWGGEEFLLVLPGVDLDTAHVLAERVRAAVESLDTQGIGPVTISAGAARFETDYDFALTLRTADQRLYQAKAAGRNRVM